MKRSILSIALLISLVSSSFATDAPTAEVSGTTLLSAEEIALEAELEQELSVDVDVVLTSLSEVQNIEAVKVFDIDGNEVAAFEGTNVLENVPAEAELLMTDGATQYYVVAE